MFTRTNSRAQSMSAKEMGWTHASCFRRSTPKPDGCSDRASDFLALSSDSSAACCNDAIENMCRAVVTPTMDKPK